MGDHQRCGIRVVKEVAAGVELALVLRHGSIAVNVNEALARLVKASGLKMNETVGFVVSTDQISQAGDRSTLLALSLA